MIFTMVKVFKVKAEVLLYNINITVFLFDFMYHNLQVLYIDIQST